MFKKVTTGVAVAAVSVLALLPAVAQAKTETASAKGVKATFSYQGHDFTWKNLKLTIARGGKVVYSHAVSDPQCGAPSCQPGNLSGGKSVHVLDLARDGREEVVLDLYSGGAHCCFVTQIFSWSATHKTYTKTSRNFLDAGYTLVTPKRGPLEFRSADELFVGVFGPFAASGFPVQVLTFHNGRFHDVTRAFPTLIGKDAAGWLKVFKAHYKGHAGNGAIAAWAADEELLGHSKQVNSYLAQQLKAGHLKSSDPAFYPGGKAFVKELMKLLKTHGYIH